MTQAELPQALAAWHALVRQPSLEGLHALLADEVVFHSPVVHTPQRGRAITAQYLGAALQVFDGPSFRYVRQIVGEHDAMLEFQTEMGGVQVNGVDIIHWNEAGLIDDFKVLVRPLKGMQAVHERMAAMFAAMAPKT